MAQLHPSRFAQEGFGNELELYQRALQLNPLELDAVLGTVEYFLRENRRNEALALLEKYLRLNPHHLPTLMALGRIYIENGDLPRILPLFETIVRLDPQNAEAFYNLGITYYHRSDLDSAMRFFERALQISDYPEAHIYLAQIHEKRGDTTTAIQHLRERIRLSSGDDDVYAAEARQHLYRLLLKRGEIPEHLLPDTLKQQ
jgi:tetratricopeptide (TPR) repeat protein